MKMIIDINPEMKDWIVNGFPDEEDMPRILRVIKHATPLEECEDAISRQAAIDACLNGWNKDYKEIVEEIRALPPVKPQYTDAEIQKMQDLEFAEIQKAYEIGKAENPNKWIPVSERLPEKPDNYPYCEIRRVYFLVSLASGCVKTLGYEFDRDKWQITGSPVVAWMPLPEPYKASPAGAESEE